jgi:hypothetical protein
MALIYSPFYILKALVIYYSACGFYISIIAFLMAVAHYITEGDGVSNLTI